MINEIYFRRRKKLLLEPGSKNAASPNYAATFVQNIGQLGFCFSQSLLDVIVTYSIEQLEQLYIELVPILKKSIGDHVSYSPMYPNFPQQVMELSEAQLVWNAIIHYITNGYYMPSSEKKERLPLWETPSMTMIEQGTEEEFHQIFTNLMLSKTSISVTDYKDLCWFFENVPNYWRYLPSEIPMKENAAYLSKLILEHAPLANAKTIRPYFKTATDVLRLACALSNGDFSLAENTRFKSFKRSHRRMMLTLLESMGSIEEDMSRYQGQWIRLGERLHPGEYTQYPKTKRAFEKIRNKEPIYCFHGVLEKAIQQKDTQKALSLLCSRPGEFARKIDYLLRNALWDWEEIVQKFDSVAEKIDTPVLLQVRQHFLNRQNNEMKVRIFFPKGVLAKAKCIENQLEPLPPKIAASIVAVCERALSIQYAARPALGKVYIEKELENFLVPFSQRSAQKSSISVPRGSRVSLSKDTEVVRTFLWWKNGNGQRTDLDLSAVLFDENWKYLEHISFTNLKSHHYQCCHSGDIVDAPRGASEFIDVDIASLQKYGCRYLAFNVLSYTGQHFCNLPECFMGFMQRKKVNSGEIFEPKTVEIKMDITGDCQLILPFVLDTVQKQYIWADLSIKRNHNWYNTVEANQGGIIAACQCVTELKKPNLYDLIYLNAKARGEICQQKEDADIIFSQKEGITPFDLDIIAAQYL